MIRLLRFLLTGDGHLHKWTVIERAQCTGDGSAWTRHYCRCEHCGRIRVFDYDD